jgi:hypothetical protein
LLCQTTVATNKGIWRFLFKGDDNVFCVFRQSRDFIFDPKADRFLLSPEAALSMPYISSTPDIQYRTPQCDGDAKCKIGGGIGVGDSSDLKDKCVNLLCLLFFRFVVIGSDGLWDALDDNDVAKFVEGFEQKWRRNKNRGTIQSFNANKASCLAAALVEKVLQVSAESANMTVRDLKNFFLIFHRLKNLNESRLVRKDESYMMI